MNQEEFDKLTKVTTNNSSEDRITKYFPAKLAERKEGDIASGEYVGAVEFEQDDGSKTVYYKLKNEDGTVYGVRANKIIERAFSTIKVGTGVAVRYNGMRMTSNNRRVNDFDIRLMAKE